MRLGRGTMRLLTSIDTPVILVGPGVLARAGCRASAGPCGPFFRAGIGIAATRALVQTRVHAGASETRLVVGHRYCAKDYPYADDWRGYREQGMLILFEAFTRDQQVASRSTGRLPEGQSRQ